jgi:5-methylcytosine-specific restriction endonuclease McrA
VRSRRYPIARRSPPGRKRKSVYRQTILELDKLCADAVRARDGNHCTLCGVPSEGRRHDWAHVFSRRYLHTRWDWENSTTLCRRCHQWGTRFPDEWFALVEKRMGLERYRSLRLRAFSRTGKPDLALWRVAVESDPRGLKPW